MQIHGLRNVVGLGVMAILVSVPVRAQQQSGSSDAVAEAARKAREQKKDAPKTKKVYTEDDFGGKTGGVSTVGAASAQTGTATSTGVDSQGSAGGLTPEQMWRKRFTEQRAKIARAEQELDLLQKEENKAGVQYYSDPTKAMKEQLTRSEINSKAAKLDAKKKEIANLTQQLDDMEDALRKSGGDAGWAR